MGMDSSTAMERNKRRFGKRERGSRGPGTSGTEPRPRFSAGEAGDVSISAVSPQARNPERVNVFVGGQYAFSLNAMLALEVGLKAGAVLSQEALDEVLSRDDITKAVEACVRLLTYRPRSESELLRRLAQKGYDPAIAHEALEKVRALGYVNDEDFARFWVQNREQFKPMGARRLRSELMAKGVDRDIAQEVIEEELPAEEDANALRAARGKLRTYAGADYPTFRRRMGGFLARQGYGWDTSSRVMKQLWAELRPEDGGEGDVGA